MYQRILVAIDDSEISRLALREATRLARTLGATLCIVHGVDATTTNAYKRADLDHFVQPHLASGRTMLDETTASVRKAGIPTEDRLLEIDTLGRDRLAEAILEEAESWAADLILVGTHARRGVSHLLLGSVAEGIVHGASQPVIVVPGAASPAQDTDPPYASILVAVDGSEVASRALDEALSLAQLFRIDLRAVSVADNDAHRAEDVLLAAQAQAREKGVEMQTEILQSPRQPKAIANVLEAHAAAWPAHLIVLGTHGRRGLDRLRLGSVAEEVLHQAGVPVLLIRSASAAQ